MNLESLITYLEDQGIAKPGINLFLHFMPPKAKLPAILLRSPLTGTPIDYELPGYRRTKFQMLVRAASADYLEGLALAQAASDALTIEESDDLAGMSIKRMWPLHEPVSFPDSTGNANEVSVNFEAVYVIVP